MGANGGPLQRPRVRAQTYTREGMAMFDHNNPTIQTLLKQGCKVSVQAHFAAGRPLRYTAIARWPDGRRAQGWGVDADAALHDLCQRIHLASETPATHEAAT